MKQSQIDYLNYKETNYSCGGHLIISEKRNNKIHHFKSLDPQSPFAPNWDYSIINTKCDLDVQELSTLILDNEKIIIDKYPPANDDGYTGLGMDSLTSRYPYFNLLTWDHSICKQLHKKISEFHDEYVKLVGASFLSNLRVRCWANIMRKGQKIKTHYHSTHPLTYLSGHFCVQCYNSSTIYNNPYRSISEDDGFYIKNHENQMSLFPTWLPHSTTKHMENIERITIAFDIVPENGINLTNTIPL